MCRRLMSILPRLALVLSPFVGAGIWIALYLAITALLDTAWR